MRQLSKYWYKIILFVSILTRKILTYKNTLFAFKQKRVFFKTQSNLNCGPSFRMGFTYNQKRVFFKIQSNLKCFLSRISLFRLKYNLYNTYDPTL